MSKALLHLALASDVPVLATNVFKSTLRTDLSKITKEENIGYTNINLDTYHALTVSDIELSAQNFGETKHSWSFLKDLKNTGFDKERKNILVIDGFEFVPENQQIQFYNFIQEHTDDLNVTIIFPVLDIERILPEIKEQCITFTSNNISNNLQNKVAQIEKVILNRELSGSYDVENEVLDTCKNPITKVKMK